LGRREEKKVEKRQRLLAAGLSLFLEQGFDRTSIEQIASRGGVARGTYYLYFHDKQALFEALMAAWYEPVVKVLKAVTESVACATTSHQALQTYQGMGLSLAFIGASHPDEILLAFREGRRAGPAGDSLREREKTILAEVTGFTRDASERGLIRVKNPVVTVLVIMGAVERLFYEQQLGTDLGDPAAVASEVVAMFASSMGLPTG
jgi:AcrR family transcriptional regulator